MLRNERGLALIIVLWVAAALSSIAVAGSYTARLERKQASYPLKDFQLLNSALSAIEKVKLEASLDTNDYDSLKENWKTSFEKNYETEDASVYVRVDDGESAINLNTAPRQVLLKIPAIDRVSNKNELVDSLLDWKDADFEYLPDGAEEPYYRSLKSPLHCKNGPLDCMDELNLVKGFNENIVNELKKCATVHSSGKVNINTASLEALMSLPGMDYSLAQAVIANRNGSDLKEGTGDDLPYDNIQKLSDIVGAETYAQIKDLITVRSYFLKVYVKAGKGGYLKELETVLKRNGKDIKTIYLREL
ncbi:MAG: type II secretion system protein GspK [Elusimicrobia bacterium]|nr:type II secretion system protein GspK [Candidatus Liberimonas magnetica]